MLREINNKNINRAFNELSEQLHALGATHLTLFFDHEYLTTDDGWFQNDFLEDPVRRMACECEGRLIPWNLVGGANFREASVLKAREACGLFNGVTYSQYFNGVIVQVWLATNDERYDFASDFILSKAKQILPMLNHFIQKVMADHFCKSTYEAII